MTYPQNSVRGLLEFGRDQLRSVNQERALLETRLLLGHILKSSQEDLLIHDDKLVSDKDRKNFEELLKRRLQFEPIASILGFKEFFGHRFEVESGVLIPRPETESLVEGILNWIDDQGISRGKILDLGTGSGCIAISLAKALGPQFSVTGLDINPRAIALAKRNSKTLETPWVQIREGDFTEEKFSKDWTVIVSNPPYIPTEQMDGLPPDVKNYDPEDALDGGESGIEYLKFIFEKIAPCRLMPGLLAVETAGEEQRKVLEKIYFSEVSAGVQKFWHDGPHLFWQSN